jgi:tRNA-dihydrouridine synthase B
MRDEKLAEAILKATVKAVKVPVTLKMRTGWDQNSRNAPTLAKIAEDNGIQLLTIHGRTRCQFYEGKSDWEFISQVKDAVKIPVIANGDIKTFDDAVQALSASKADGVMIGRGVYGRPWFINQIAHFLSTGEKLPDPTLREQLSIILKHYDSILEYYGEHTGLRMARKHLGWYSSGLPCSSDFRTKINRMSEISEVKDYIVEFYGNV